MPAFYHPNQHSAAAIAQMIFDDMQDPPIQLVYENGDPVGDDDDDDDEEVEVDEPDNGPAPIGLQEDEDIAVADALILPEEPLFNIAAHHHHGQHHAAVMAHWFTAHHNIHVQGAAAAVFNNFLMDMDVLQPAPAAAAAEAQVLMEHADAVELNLQALPQMHLYGVLPDDLLNLFRAACSQTNLQHGATMRMLKKRIISLREKKPSTWTRLGMGLYKLTARGSKDGGCDARILVKPSQLDGAPSVVWAHKFVLATNPVFSQLFGYISSDEALVGDGKVMDVDVPSITADEMRTIVMACYDILPPKLSLEMAQNLDYWAMRFCLDDLLQLCHKVMETAPWR